MLAVSWNKTFKANCTKKYDDWLAIEGINNETKAGNLKAPPWKEIIKCILDAWAAIPSEIVKELSINCVLSLPTDRSCDNLICHFKEGQCEVMRLQLTILQDEENPFEIRKPI